MRDSKTERCWQFLSFFKCHIASVTTTLEALCCPKWATSFVTSMHLLSLTLANGLYSSIYLVSCLKYHKKNVLVDFDYWQTVQLWWNFLSQAVINGVLGSWECPIYLVLAVVLFHSEWDAQGKRNANYVFINSKFNTRITSPFHYSDNKEVPYIVTAPWFVWTSSSDEWWTTPIKN